MQELGLEKIKTVGDEYMVAAGVPVLRDDHAEAIAELALRIRDHVATHEFEGHRLQMRDRRLEIRANPELPVPPLKQWIKYYLTHPHHWAMRAYQMTLGKGILFEDQEYLLAPAG